MSMPLAIMLASFVLGLVLMAAWWIKSPAFFRNRPESLPRAGNVPPVATGTP